MAICGAKTRSGQPCQNRAMENGRCRMHGGKNKPAPKGNQYAAKPGSLYSQFLTDDENAIAASLEFGQVDEELRLTRIRLMRALQRENDLGDTLEIEAEETEPIEIDGKATGLTKTKTKSKVRDYAGLIDRLTARVESLEARRAALVAADLDAELKRLEIEKRKREQAMTSGAVTNNIMPVPTCDSVEQWEQVAQQQQDKVLGR